MCVSRPILLPFSSSMRCCCCLDCGIVCNGFRFLCPVEVGEMGVFDVADDLSKESILFSCRCVTTPCEGYVLYFAC
jgi:hypothetical protein